jgi:hypothetical protein
VGAALRGVGIKYFFHPEQDWFRFFDDPAHPELSRVHRIDWFTDHTDARYVFFEPDTMHTLAGRARFPDPVDGSLFDVDAWYGRLAAQRRLIAWHVKDADRITPPPPPGTNPFTQTRIRPGFPLNDGVDVVYVGEASVGRGYPFDPDPAVIGFPGTFQRYRLSPPGWFHTESDSGPGPAADPGRSLRWAKVSARYMLYVRSRQPPTEVADGDARATVGPAARESNPRAPEAGAQGLAGPGLTDARARAPVRTGSPEHRSPRRSAASRPRRPRPRRRLGPRRPRRHPRRHLIRALLPVT